MYIHRARAAGANTCTLGKYGYARARARAIRYVGCWSRMLQPSATRACLINAIRPSPRAAARVRLADPAFYYCRPRRKTNSAASEAAVNKWKLARPGRGFSALLFWVTCVGPFGDACGRVQVFFSPGMIRMGYVWRYEASLMEAGVGVGVLLRGMFAWILIKPPDGKYCFGNIAPGSEENFENICTLVHCRRVYNYFQWAFFPAELFHARNYTLSMK